MQPRCACAAGAAVTTGCAANAESRIRVIREVIREAAPIETGSGQISENPSPTGSAIGRKVASDCRISLVRDRQFFKGSFWLSSRLRLTVSPSAKNRQRALVIPSVAAREDITATWNRSQQRGVVSVARMNRAAYAWTRAAPDCRSMEARILSGLSEPSAGLSGCDCVASPELGVRFGQFRPCLKRAVAGFCRIGSKGASP